MGLKLTVCVPETEKKHRTNIVCPMCRGDGGFYTDENVSVIERVKNWL